METIHIACASDERYFPGLLGTLSSLIVSAREECEMQFHIIDGGIGIESWNFPEGTLKRFGKGLATRYSIGQEHFEGFPDFFFDSKMAYARLLLPDLIQVEKIIYVDTDILFCKDISLLWQLDFNEVSAMASLEAGIKTIGNDCPLVHQLNLDPEAPYFNSGVMYLNLEECRRNKIFQKTMVYLRQFPEACKFWDQSALNVTLYNHWRLLDQSWNTQSHREVFKIEERLGELAAFQLNFHFVTAFKPWLRYNDSPSNLLFYAVLDEIGYKLKDKGFIETRKTYSKKMKILPILPLLYRTRALVKKLRGSGKQADKDRAIATFWEDQSYIIKFQRNQSKMIQKMVNAWQKKIQKALQPVMSGS